MERGFAKRGAVDANFSRWQCKRVGKTADEFQQVTPTLYYWQAYEPSVKCDLSCCALITPAGMVFIDPIPLAAPSLKELTVLAKPAAVLLTNGNHARAAADYRTRFGIPIFAHADAAQELGIALDGTLADGDTAPGGLRVVSLSGAAAGEIAFVGDGVVCVGDALIHVEPNGFAMLPAKYCADARELARSLRKLLSFDAGILTFAHGTPLTANTQQRLTALLA